VLDSESMIWLRRPYKVISVYLAVFCQFLQLTQLPINAVTALALTSNDLDISSQKERTSCPVFAAAPWI
jgi:hypothetical protein